MNASRALSSLAAASAMGLVIAAFPAGCSAPPARVTPVPPDEARLPPPVPAPTVTASAKPEGPAPKSHRFAVASENPSATRIAMSILERKMESINLVNPDVIVTANPGCMLQLRAGAKMHGRGQRVAHVVEILDEAYRKRG